MSAQPSYGPLAGGNVVTLVGSSLGNGVDASVLFDSTPPPGGLQHQNDTHLVMVVPGSTTPGVVKVSTNSTSRGSARNTVYTYMPGTPHVPAPLSLSFSRLLVLLLLLLL